MLRSLPAMFVVFGLLFAVPQPAQAQIQQKAYAPENLRNLSRSDQERVISLEYSEQSRGRRIPDDQLRFYLDQVNRSSWGFSRIKQDIAASLGGGNGGWDPDPGNSILCESNDNRRRQCNTGFRGRASLSQNLSDTRCIEGQNWGGGNGYVWVDRGCRARFVEDYDNGFGSILCESNDNRRRQCNTGFRGRASLSQNISDTRCIEGQNWGSGNGYVWVDRGCRARFVEGYGNGSGSILCESNDNRRRQCNTGFRGRASLSQNISDTRCIEGQNWGSGNGYVWVDRGCRARFVDDSYAGGGSGNKVRCESTDNRYRECNTGFRGNARVNRQLSDTRCTEGQTWGQRNNGTIWVNRGCRAEFIESDGNWNPGDGNSNYSVTCSSQDNRRATCAWNSRYGRPYLIQQISSDSCREGSTWGYLRGNIWVDRGCRARFGAR